MLQCGVMMRGHGGDSPHLTDLQVALSSTSLTSLGQLSTPDMFRARVSYAERVNSHDGKLALEQISLF